MLRIAVPNKGSLSEAASAMLREAGYSQRRESRELILDDLLADGVDAGVHAGDRVGALRALGHGAGQLGEQLFEGLHDGQLLQLMTAWIRTGLN